MFTVIVAKENNKYTFEDYHFLCLPGQINENIFWYQWQKDDTAENFLLSLNMVLMNHHTWKLVIWNGTKECMNFENPEELNEELFRLIRLLSGMEMMKPDICFKGSAPELIYGLVFRRKSDRIIHYPCDFQKIDKERWLPQNFRLFLWEMEKEDVGGYEYNGLILNCVLLILALNEIPMVLLTYGYLYQLHIKIDKRELAQSINRWENRLLLIEDEIEKERLYLEQEKKGRLRFDSIREARETFIVNKTWVNDRMGKRVESEIPTLEPGDIKLSSDEALAEFQVKLEDIYYALRKQSTYPKGVLENIMKEINDTIQKPDKWDGFLRDEDTDDLEMEQGILLRKMYSKKKARVRHSERMEKMKKWEEKMLEYLSMTVTQSRYYIIILIFIIAELLMLSPFFYTLCTDTALTREVKPGFYIIMFIIFVCIILTNYVYRIIYSYRIKRFNHELRYWNNDVDNIRKYIADMLVSIANFQYYEGNKKNNQEKLILWKEKKKVLAHHTQMNSKRLRICRKMKLLSEYEHMGLAGKIGKPMIDFAGEPNENDYSLLEENNLNNTAELNKSGLQLKTGNPFVKEIYIGKVEK